MSTVVSSSSITDRKPSGQPVLYVSSRSTPMFRSFSRSTANPGSISASAVPGAFGAPIDIRYPPGTARRTASQVPVSVWMVMFAAFFLVTDFSSTPVTGRGLLLYGLSAGALAMVLRMSDLEFGPVAFAVVITSLATPLFDRIADTPFGKVVHHA